MQLQKWILFILPIFMSSAASLAFAKYPSVYVNSSNTQPISSQHQLNDNVITTRIKTLLMADSAITSLSIKVITRQGIVTLKGKVGSHEEQMRAVQIARSVNGVKDVQDRLIVQR